MLFFYLFLLIIIQCHSYIISFNINIRNNMINCVSNFMNLNEILVKNDYTNYMKIQRINNSSLIFNYKTYSIIEDYIYNNIYLIKNKNTYLIKYSFYNFNDEYKYLIFIKAFNKTPNRTIWNLKIKYNKLLFDNKIENDKLIYKYIYKCVNKKINQNYHPILDKYFFNNQTFLQDNHNLDILEFF